MDHVRIKRTYRCNGSSGSSGSSGFYTGSSGSVEVQDPDHRLTGAEVCADFQDTILVIRQ
jgi:hypothetical protein